MPDNPNMRINPETLLYEISTEPPRKRLVRYSLIFLASVALAVLYFWFLFIFLGLDTPKAALLKKTNAAWNAKVAVLSRDMDRCEEILEDLELRNSDVYRSIFGMSEIPRSAVTGAGEYEGDFDVLSEIGRNSRLRENYIRLEELKKRTYVQLKSFDEVEALSKRAGDMASSIPNIPPIDPNTRNYRISSTFGVRTDPVYGGLRRHMGVDFAAKKGTPIYATGDGVIESVKFQFFGYGNMVVIDHGFGYQTMYAHMSEVFVTEGMQIKRGQCIGAIGRTGKSTGDHLHYEVIYRGNKVNPANYYDLSVSKEEYAAMVQKREEESPAMLKSGFKARTKR